MGAEKHYTVRQLVLFFLVVCPRTMEKGDRAGNCLRALGKAKEAASERVLMHLRTLQGVCWLGVQSRGSNLTWIPSCSRGVRQVGGVSSETTGFCSEMRH